MFSFSFKLKRLKDNWTININDHKIQCSKNNSQIISKKINKYIQSLDKSSTDEKNGDSFTIQISQLENPLICSESDYTFFHNIFNLIPVKINSTNKEALKILAEELEITELKNIIDMFERSFETITEDSVIQLQKEITNKIMEIDEENFDETLNYIDQIDSENENEKENVASNDFLYSVVLTACQTRSHKIELLMNFLKELEKRSNKGQFAYFKKLILPELNDNSESNEIKFVVRYLNEIKEIEAEVDDSVKTYDEDDMFYNDIFGYNDSDDDYDLENQNENKQKLTEEQMSEYKKTGYNPLKIYQAIKDDDIEVFSQIMSEDTDTNKYNKKVKTLSFERNTILSNRFLTYVDLCAFYGSEKVFNFIMMNIDPEKLNFNLETIVLSFVGGNITIIQKCMDYSMTEATSIYLLKTIEYNRNEVFEWLVESNNSIITNNKSRYKNLFFPTYGTVTEEELFLKAIKFNNFDALFYLLSIGFDYTPLFTFALLYNNYYLANIALKLDYNCNKSSDIVSKIEYSPYLYCFNDELPIFVAIYKDRIDFVKKIIDSGMCKKNWKYQETSPPYFASVYDRIEILKYLLETKVFPLNSKTNNILLSEYAIQKNQKEIIDYFVLDESTELIGQYTHSIIKFNFYDNGCKNKYKDVYFAFNHQPNFRRNFFGSMFTDYYNRSNFNEDGRILIPLENSLIDYAQKLILYFINDSENDNSLQIEEKKKQIVDKNKEMFILIAARTSNEDNFVKFLEKYKLNLDELNDRNILLLSLFLSIITFNCINR